MMCMPLPLLGGLRLAPQCDHKRLVQGPAATPTAFSAETSDTWQSKPDCPPSSLLKKSRLRAACPYKRASGLVCATAQTGHKNVTQDFIFRVCSPDAAQTAQRCPTAMGGQCRCLWQLPMLLPSCVDSTASHATVVEPGNYTLALGAAAGPASLP